MKPKYLLLLAITACAMVSDVRFLAASPSTAEDRLAREFSNPGPEFRGKPFWSWNGELQEPELKRQMGVLKKMGMGGYFMHSRTGLKTEYLGEDWFRLINACTDAGQRQHMESWLYDEDRWPSGTAGGRVTENPKYRMKYMSMRVVPGKDFKWTEDLVAAFATDLNGKDFTECKRLSADTPASGYAPQTVLAFTIEEMAKNSFYNGFTYADTLKREATDCFITLTHEQYKAHCGDRVGTSIKGIFADEPHRGSVMTAFSLDNTNKLQMTPWTEDLPAQFQKRFGYDLVERLPELFFHKDGQAIAQVKWHYMDLLQTLFLENWAKPIHEWCKTNHMIFTGHALHEDALACQATMQGSLMRYYECEDWPGVDVLTENNRAYWIVKQVASTARQTGKKRILSELYGCTGWQFNFESHKFVGDWQALFGVNLRCPHLSWYTMAGQAKRDYPASIFFQSAWYKDYSFVEDYYTRLNLMLAQGKPACDVLVINPVESLWCQIGVGWASGLSANTSETQAIERAYAELFSWLAGSHIDFDYGDEEMIGRLCKVQNDAAGQAILRVGEAPYRAVVVPKMATIRSSTLKALDEFRRAGGRVIFLGEAPAYVDAVKSSGAADLAEKAQHLGWKKEALIDACRAAVQTPVELVDSNGNSIEDVFCQTRVDHDRAIIVAMSMNREKWVKGATLRAKAYGQLSEWNCETGQRAGLASRSAQGWTEWTTDFAPLGEHVFVIGKTQEKGLKPKPVLKEVSRQTLSGPFAFRLSEPNVCVLDLAQYQIDGGRWHSETEVLKIDRAARKSFGLPWRGGEMVQPWFSKKHDPNPTARGKVTMRFAFKADILPQSNVLLAMEQPENFKITFNGQPLASKGFKGWWVDPAIKTIAIPARLFTLGSNCVELATDYRQDVDIEALYLLGKFAVRLNGTEKTLAQLPEKLAPADIAAQGLPFYSGAITYDVPTDLQTRPGDCVFIETPQFEGACVKVKAPRGSARMIAWQPYRAEITEGWKNKGMVEVEVVLTRRNSFGPLHAVPLRATGYGPDNFTTDGPGWTQNYQLYPAGLLRAPEIVVEVAAH